MTKCMGLLILFRDFVVGPIVKIVYNDVYYKPFQLSIPFPNDPV